MANLCYSDVSKISFDDLGPKSCEKNREAVESISSDDQMLSEDEELVNGVNEHHVNKNSIPDKWGSDKPSTTVSGIFSSVESGYLELVEPLSDVYVPLIDIKTGKIYEYGI